MWLSYRTHVIGADASNAQIEQSLSVTQRASLRCGSSCDFPSPLVEQSIPCRQSTWRFPSSVVLMLQMPRSNKTLAEDRALEGWHNLSYKSSIHAAYIPYGNERAYSSYFSPKVFCHTSNTVAVFPCAEPLLSYKGHEQIKHHFIGLSVSMFLKRNILPCYPSFLWAEACEASLKQNSHLSDVGAAAESH